MFYTKAFVILFVKTFDKNARTPAANQSRLFFLWTHIRLNTYNNFEKIQKIMVLARNINIIESMKQKLNRTE